MPAGKHKPFLFNKKYIFEHGKSAKGPYRSSVNFNLQVKVLCKLKVVFL